MAKSKKQRRNRLRLEAINSNFATPEGANKIFEWFNQAGYMPAKDAHGHLFGTLDQFIAAVQEKVNAIKDKKPAAALKEVLSDLAANRSLRQTKTGEQLLKVVEKTAASTEAHKKLGTSYEGIPLEISAETGNVRVASREYFENVPQPLQDHIKEYHGSEKLAEYQKAVKKEWHDMLHGPSGTRQKAIETGTAWDRGHFLANKYGGAQSGRAGSPELAEPNRMHGAGDRGQHLDYLSETGRSRGWLEDFYLWDAEVSGNSIYGSDKLTSADLEAISKGTDPNKILLDPNRSKRGLLTESLGDRTLRQAAIQLEEEILREIVGGWNGPRGKKATPSERVKAQAQLDEIVAKSTGRVGAEGYDIHRPPGPDVRTMPSTEILESQALRKAPPIPNVSTTNRIMKEGFPYLQSQSFKRASQGLNIGTKSGRALDQALQTGMMIDQGNYYGAALQGSQLLAGQALQSNAAQKQAAKLLAKQGSKSALKLIPGLDIVLSGIDAYGYATQGKWDQAGISALSGAVGWVPGAGDALSAGLDLYNTSRDIEAAYGKNAVELILERLNNVKTFQ